MNKIKNLLKGSPIAMVIVGLLVAGIASAAILAIYTTMLGEGTVEQSVVFGNGDISKTYTIGDSPAIAGNTYTQAYNLLNRSETTAPIKFVTNQCIVGGGHCGDSNYDELGVETSYWSTVVLATKDTTTWAIIDEKATLTYNLVSSKFEYELEANDLELNTSYSLIYYADQQNRFVDWGGDNPGALIATFITDSNGDILAAEGDINLAMNLPHADDWNGSAGADYCEESSDKYDLCRGAKIWLVPTADYNSTNKKIRDANWVNADKFLFETDLITYHDSDKGGGLNLGKGMLNFFVKNVLAINLTPGGYQIKTEVRPVVQ